MYDYSLKFLDRHADLVRQLEDIFATRGQRQMEFDRPEDLHIARQTINNVLASIALHNPSKAQIRQLIRTWYEYRNEKWYLNVGVPKHNLRGSTNQLLKFTAAHEAAGMPEQGIIRYDEDIRGQPDITKFIGWFLEKQKNPAITGIRMEVHQAPRSVDYWNRTIEGWTAKCLDDTTILLERQ